MADPSRPHRRGVAQPIKREELSAMSEGPLPGQEDLFGLLGEGGEEHRKASEGPKMTPKAKEKLDQHNEKAKDEEKIDPAKLQGSGTGKDGIVTAPDVQREITRKNLANRPKPPGVTPAAEPETYPEGLAVYYGGHQLAVPDLTWRIEEVRTWLIETHGFKELSKERANLLYDKEINGIVPVLKGHTKGAGEKPMEVYRVIPDAEVRFSPRFYILGNDGVYEVRKTQAGQFIARVKSDRDIQEGVVLSVPRIPAHVLRGVVTFFRLEPERERMANVIYDRRWPDMRGDGEPIYYFDLPAQEGTATSVTAAGAVETEDRFVVLQVHSHGKMNAFFSAIDDEDEVRTGLYGVIGHCDWEKPIAKFRYSCAGTYRAIPAEAIFENGWQEVIQDEARLGTAKPGS